MKGFAAALPLLLLAACAGPEKSPQAPSAPASQPAETARNAPETIQSQPLKHLLGRKLKPMPDKELEVRARCGFRDVNGGRGRLDLHVAKAEVRRFVAEVTIPGHGVCSFDMKQFAQTAKMPNVVLNARQDACTVRMWEQGKEVTVAFNGCQAKCSGDAFSYLWPILVDRGSGRCA